MRRLVEQLRMKGHKQWSSRNVSVPSLSSVPEKRKLLDHSGLHLPDILQG
jgi:hypothetical protein